MLAEGHAFSGHYTQLYPLHSHLPRIWIDGRGGTYLLRPTAEVGGVADGLSLCLLPLSFFRCIILHHLFHCCHTSPLAYMYIGFSALPN